MLKKKDFKDYGSLGLWIIFLITVGFLLGSTTKNDVHEWYTRLQRSSLTPPDYVFPIVWTILYIMLAICGWLLWRPTTNKSLHATRKLYCLQLLLNWIWVPLFFHYHMISLSVLNILALDISVMMIIYKTHKQHRLLCSLMSIYLLWLLFATYLNLYIWYVN